MTDEQSTVPATDAGREIILNQIYLKDCSYERRMAAHSDPGVESEDQRQHEHDGQ